MSVTKPRKAEQDFSVRQNRHIIQDLDFKLKTEFGEFEILNFSFFGVAISVTSKTVKFIEGNNYKGTLFLEGKEIQTIDLLPVRSETKESGQLIALRTEDEAIEVEKIFFIADAVRSLKEFEMVARKFDQLPQQLKDRVYELRSSLEEIKERVDALSSNKIFPSFAQKETFENAAVTVYSPFIRDLLQSTNQELSKHFDLLGTEVRPLAFEFYRTQLKHLIYESLFADRSLRKPRGYAGDYEMMNLIYRNESIGKGLFSRCMEQGIQLHLEPGAVRNRAAYLKDKIIKTVRGASSPIRILSVACGPAMEVRYAIEELSDEELTRVEFFLLDQDEDALRDAEKNILLSCSRRSQKPKLSLVHQTMKSVIMGDLSLSDLNLVYSAGLFDYFTNPVCIKASQSLLSTLAKNGRLVIGNFDILTTNWFAMLAIFDWHLILRSREQMLEMYAHPECKTEIESEPNGINLFCVITKNA